MSVSVSAAPSGGLSEPPPEEDGSGSSLQEETADEMETITEERSPSPGSRRFSYVSARRWRQPLGGWVER